MPGGRGAAVLARTELCRNRAAAGGLDEHGQEILEPSPDSLPAPHGKARVNLMGTNEERGRNFIAQEAAEWFVANREGLSAKERDAFAAWLNVSPVHVEE